MDLSTQKAKAETAANPGHGAIERIVGVSAWSDQVRRSIELVAAHQSSVLIMGPSGTGKELIARAVHACSTRAKKPFVPVDCAVTTGTLFASHMFGHVKGSFTGATSSTLGCFRAASGGTIFLDEIGEMELELQAKLLRVLQQRVVVPVGSHEETPVDVRVLAATNRDLAVEVNEGRFREDLFYRLNVVAIRTIPLRERPEDVAILAHRYLAELAARHGMPMCTLSPEALDVLRGYAWPGNVRELENVLERAVMFSSGDRIEPDALGGLMSDPAASEVPKKGMAQIAAAANQGIVSATPVPGVFRVEPKMDAPAGLEDVVDTDNWPTLADVERLHLERTLAATVHNKSLAAKMLGIDRSVLRRKLVRYGLLAEDEE
ncbi:MAG: sigma-54 dependent transcriptional regulator [Planctomycetota bacterium]|jgi:DNA-binding NtrC family response regulator|nr:sigma-54 dependent transcriptional regulator [Planctomycetota bacterium]MDA1202465.1 sigma-54 dependent transcriptional regulator [Planctomycetota bacterium]